MVSEKATTAERGLVGRVDDLQAQLAAQTIQIANLHKLLQLTLDTVDRFADVKPEMAVEDNS